MTLLLDLSAEARGLIVGVVELREAVAGFATGDVKLKAFRDLGVFIRSTRERRDFRRVVEDEGRFDQFRFGRFFKEGDLQGTETGVDRDFRLEASEFGAKELGVFEVFGLVVRAVLLHRFNGRQTREGLREVDFLPLVGEHRGARRFDRDFAQQSFGEIHLIAIRPVGRVELHHREFGVVTDRDTFVAEVAVDFEDAFEAPDDETLQIELGCNAQVHVHVERVVVRHEGLGVGTARNRVEHRSFHFEEAVLQHVGANCRNRLGANEEAVARFFVHDEVDVALAVAELGVNEPLVLVGQRTNVLRHETDFARADREFARLRAEEHALDGHDVAEVERLESGVGVFAHFVFLNEILHFARKVAHGGKACLAHDALEHHAARAGDLGSERFEFFGGLVAVGGSQVAEKVRANEIVRIGHARFAQLRKFRAALGNDVVFVFRRFADGILRVNVSHDRCFRRRAALARSDRRRRWTRFD